MILAPSCDSSIGHLTILQQVTAISLSSIGGPIMSSRERQKGNMTKDSVSLLPCFYFVELPILVSSVVSLYFLELTDVFKPVRSGYSCHDRSLSLPYIESTHEIIPLLMLLSLAFAGPAITIMIGEGILFCCLSRKRKGVGAEADINAAGCSFNSFIRRAVRFIGVHVFGLCATALITDILQLATGYHAPYFLTVCKPNYTTLNTTCDENTYILQDICSGSEIAAINQGRKSFPSQHATLASFAAVYISMYFNSTLTESSKLLKPLLVFSFVICAIICGLTRIIQYKNHAIDVYLGFLLGGGIAVYLGLYAVGNFQPSEDSCSCPPPQPRGPCPIPHISQEAMRHLQVKSCSANMDGLSTSHSEGILHHNPHHRDPSSGSLTNLKRSSAEVEVITSPRSPMGKESMVTFSHTLPRVHTPAMDDGTRRNATIHHSHHASMDSSRSKQLLSQWKSKNQESRKHSLQVMEGEAAAQSPHHRGSMDSMRYSSEPSAVGINGVDLPTQYVKLATGASTTLPRDCSGITGGARVSMQSRPGSSQLVHIPEETHENFNNPSPKMGAGDVGGGDICNSGAHVNWVKAAEKATAPCRTMNGSQQPRIMQVIAMSKQQGLLQTHSKSMDEGCMDGYTGGSLRYRTLNEPNPMGTTCSTLGSSVGSISGSTGAIVRVDAHPENNNNRPMVHAPSTDISSGGSWKTWRSQDQCGGGGIGGCSQGQSFELNDLNRDSESCESLSMRDGSIGSIDRRRHANPTAATNTQNAGGGEHSLQQQQGITTIRVTPVEGGEVPSEPHSVASSRDSTLRRKGKGNIILIPERGNSPDNTRNVFYKGTSSTPGL
uniref:phospholipid phosphatase-related protein type 4 n=1 Tax=Oncorhynchus gorbuscha TaxID=8017 RepID=UPI001EAF48CD|nr:phospholipid phosphatase-related protein type 4 [Oncorhynchus gorbuscha]